MSFDDEILRILLSLYFWNNRKEFDAFMIDRNLKKLKDFDSYFQKAQVIYNDSKQKNINIHFLGDDSYPKLLKECEDCPICLYSFGNVNFENHIFISIIGTRIADNLAKDCIDKICQNIKKYNIKAVIVSGLALGADTYAHQAALANNIPTIAVLGTGLDLIYPKENRNLAKQIIENNGGIITEFPYKYSGTPDNFIRRNRIVAGISKMTIVTQTDIKGGSMITAKMAFNYNRDVFAFPGQVDNPKYAGCNSLISNNQASLITCFDDLIRLGAFVKY